MRKRGWHIFLLLSANSVRPKNSLLPLPGKYKSGKELKEKKRLAYIFSFALLAPRDQKKLFFIAPGKCNPCRLALAEIRLAKTVSYFALRVSGLKARSYFFEASRTRCADVFIIETFFINGLT